jgi:hypothetical protein
LNAVRESNSMSAATLSVRNGPLKSRESFTLPDYGVFLSNVALSVCSRRVRPAIAIPTSVKF